MSEIASFGEFLEQANALEELDKSLAFDYEDPDQNEAARSHVFAIRKVRAALDKTRKEEKAASLARGRLVDSEAKEIAERFTTMIDAHQTPLTAVEQREAARTAAHYERLERLRALGTPTNELNTAAELRKALDQLHELAAADWEEYGPEAERIAADAEQYLDGAITQADHNERRDRELAEIKADLDRRTAADEERGRQQAQAEHDAREERERIEREAQQEADRIERDARIAKETEQRIQREAAANKAKEARREKRRRENAKHVAKIRAEAATCLVVAAGLDQARAEIIIELIASNAITHVELKL